LAPAAFAFLAPRLSAFLLPLRAVGLAFFGGLSLEGDTLLPPEAIDQRSTPKHEKAEFVG